VVVDAGLAGEALDLVDGDFVGHPARADDHQLGEDGLFEAEPGGAAEDDPGLLARSDFLIAVDLPGRDQVFALAIESIEDVDGLGLRHHHLGRAVLALDDLEPDALADLGHGGLVDGAALLAGHNGLVHQAKEGAAGGPEHLAERVAGLDRSAGRVDVGGQDLLAEVVDALHPAGADDLVADHPDTVAHLHLVRGERLA